MELLRPGVRVHLVGIGGIGMSAIARVLHGWGYAVSGSDRDSSPLTEALQAEGIRVEIGHRAENLTGDEVVVVISSAIPRHNPEVAEAARRGFPVVKRDRILGELAAGKFVMAVAGTHGKTTTSAMLAWILLQAGLDPTFIVGGILLNLGTNARAGRGPILVIEADEYDRTFLGLWPDVTVVTSLEHDHPDCYPTFDQMYAAFVQFATRSRQRLLVCGESPATRQLGEEVQAADLQDPARAAAGRVLFYGASNTRACGPSAGTRACGPSAGTRACGPSAGPSEGGWDWRADDVQLGGSPTFKVTAGTRRVGTCALQLPGRHNVLNAVAALAAAAEVGVDPGIAVAALTRFRGTARRFELKGQAAGITVVDDYAHHPTEIRATLAAARSKYPERPIWVVFQPHTYSRTRALLDDFAAALGEADHVLVTRIYAAREADAHSISGADLVARIKSGLEGVAGVADASYVDSLDDAVLRLLQAAQPGAVVLTLGAGDSYLVGERLLERLSEREAASRPACVGSPGACACGPGAGEGGGCSADRQAGSWRLDWPWTH